MTDLRLPRLGDVMTEGRLVAWLEADGAQVRAGQPLYELETDKVSFTVEAPADGRLRHVVAAGEVVDVGTLVGQVLDAEGGTEVAATPAARRLARELGVDLASLGSGRRIREDDVRAFHAATAAPAPAAPAAATSALRYRGRRRAIGERMARSQRTAAAVTLSSEVPVDAALDLADRLNAEWRGEGVVVTLTRLVVRACALALREHPVLNGRLVEDRIELPATVDIGVAVDVEEGLVVPVLRGADGLTLAETARGVRALAERAEAGRLARDDLEGATFTVSSLASTLVDAFTPIIDPPQVAILGVGRVREVPAFDGGAVVRRRVTTLSLTFDHRVTDGAPAARFLGRVAELLGSPESLRR